MEEWLKNNIISILALLVGVVVSYHVFFLSRKVTHRMKFDHKENIKRKVRELLDRKITRVYLVNLKRYFKDYPLNEEKHLSGYSHIKGEIKSVRFNGIEFFAEMPRDIYRKNGKLSFKGSPDDKPEYLVYPVGIIPYEWIENIDPEGDEYGYIPLFFCHFKGRVYWKFWKKFLFYGYPYQKLIYYKKIDDNTPSEMRYQLIEEQIK